MQNLLGVLPESVILSGKLTFNDACISDTDYFIKILSAIQGKSVVPDLSGPTAAADSSPESLTASWVKKKLFIETLIGILPPEKDSIPCDYLLRLLRAASSAGVGPAFRSDLENRISGQLDGASLEELMIPCFSHTSATLLDFELVVRLVKGFVNSEDVSRGGAALMRVAKLVDLYLAEAAVDSNLGLSEFVELADALPSHARSTDDGIYRAIDTYLKAHPGLSKQERKRLWSLIESRKLSAEASFHAAQNERLPVRAVIQVLLSEQNKMVKNIDSWSGPHIGTRSPGMIGLDGPARCVSKRETIAQMEIKRLKEDVLMLQCQCMNMERQIDKLLLEKKKGCYFSWKRLFWNHSK